MILTEATTKHGHTCNKIFLTKCYKRKHGRKKPTGKAPSELVSHANSGKRSVGHAQLMHDKGRTIHEYTRRMWLHELLEEVHTADDRAPPAQSRTSSQSFSGNHQKPSGATKDLSDRFRQDRVGPNLPQETNKAQAYKESLKVATKRKKKVRLGRRRENDKKRRRARSVLTKAPPRMAI
ncbi:unnamed protein product [Oreochromis niloticus]|nr:unnamed protein product [Mustela putorius furo]